MDSRRGQGMVFEYLFIFAFLVFVSALAIFLLTDSESDPVARRVTQSQMYWSSTPPITIEEHHEDPDSRYFEIMVRNNAGQRIILDEVRVVSMEGVGGVSDMSHLLDPGERTRILLDHRPISNSPQAAVCTEGGLYSYKVTMLFQVVPTGQNRTFSGVFPLIGVCGSVNATAASKPAPKSGGMNIFEMIIQPKLNRTR